MKRKSIFIWLTLSMILALSFTTSTNNIAEEEIPRPTSIEYSSLI
ncbi:hypothetical protein [Bacillus sp. FJAT-22090]|nr:hypothetical protein [Bacillus sp. FJAT-22090]